jgi:hypothetical protein
VRDAWDKHKLIDEDDIIDKYGISIAYLYKYSGSNAGSRG